MRFCIIDCIKINPALHERIKYPLNPLISKNRRFQSQIQNRSILFQSHRDAGFGTKEDFVLLTNL